MEDPTFHRYAYLWYVWSHSISSLKQISSCKLQSFVRVSITTLPKHSVKHSINLLCTLSVPEAHLYYGIVTVRYSCYMCDGITDVKFADQRLKESLNSFPIPAPNTSR